MKRNSYALERALYGGVDPNSDFSMRCETGREYVDRISRDSGPVLTEENSITIGHIKQETDWIKWTEFKQNFLDENKISFYMTNKDDISKIKWKKWVHSKDVFVRVKQEDQKPNLS